MEKKDIAILVILFLTTSIIIGTSIAGYINSNAQNDKINSLLSIIEQNNKDIKSLEDKISELSSYDDSKLTASINLLKDKIEDLKDDNDDLEDEIKSLKNKINSLYVIIDGFGY